MNIKILSSGHGDDTVITYKNAPLHGIVSIDIQMRANGLNKAALTFIVPKLDIVTEATVSIEHLQELAASLGYDLVKRENAK